MAREPLKSTMMRNGARRSTRRARVGRQPERGPFTRALEALRSRSAAWGLLITVLLGLWAGLLAAWAREQPLLAPGQVASMTRTVRVPFQVEDREATASAREKARQAATPVFNADDALLSELRVSLESLPRTLASVQSLEQVDQTIREQFRLKEDSLRAVQAQSIDGEPSSQYLARVRSLWERLERAPLLDAKAWQRTSQGGSMAMLQLRRAGRPPIEVPQREALNVEDAESLRRGLTSLAVDAGFEGALRQVVLNRFTVNPRPTYRLDEAATQAAQTAAAEAVPPVVSDWGAGATIFVRGETVSAADIDLLRAETRHFQLEAERWRVWVRRLGVVGASMATAAGAALYAALFVPRLRKKVSRMVWIASLLGGTLAVACWASVAEPRALTVTAVIPTVFVAAILVIAYDQRVALAFSCLHAVLVCMALDQPIGMFGLILTGVVVAIWQLHEIRSRDTVLRMGLTTGLALAFATVMVLSIDRPVVLSAVRQTLWDAFWAGLGGLGVGAVILFILPLIERTFDITTGMTLIELRDPKQPLLRELQQRAPGTYNHSLNVATITEAAAAAIGADPLLCYAGALYHDIGKMNKPEYFVENQSGAISKHEKLSPAMSLLVIVGHVKDGMEMAREYGLPRSLQHFIEAHHGTTLVEFFYHRAKKLAEDAGGDKGEKPRELEYRYPGPKPRSKEVAILMIADAVESASRTLSEPTPSRIDQLVRSIANKRLLDGQFDECDLTLKELRSIVESVSKTVASSYHGRVVYPAGGEKPHTQPQPPTRATAISG